MPDNAFLKFWRLGYHRLVPVVPPKADVSPRSMLAKRLNTPQDGRGKAVGVKGRDGKWFGFDWLPYEADESDLTRWHEMGAGTGIKTGEGLVAIDADTLNEDSARIIRDVIESQFGRMPVRVGRYPKALYLCRVTDAYRYSRIEFGTRNEKNQLSCRVEILSDGRQFVAEGIHPQTGNPYYWPREIVPYAALPPYTPQQLNDLLKALAEVLPAASPIIREGATEAVSQAALSGNIETVRKAVAATPNTSAAFPSRESYRDYGYAIKAALPDHPDEAFALFSDWCARWTDGENDPNIVAADWRRMKPPFKRGANWLYELAEQHGSNFDRAEVWFSPIEADTSPFANPEPAKAQPKTDVYPILRIGDIVNRPPPIYLIKRHIPAVSVGFLYSAPGIGKTFLALDAALHTAYGKPDWYGDPIVAEDDTVVVYIAAEGSFGFRNRILAWLKRRGIEEHSQRFILIERTINFMEKEDIDRLLRTVSAAIGQRPVLIVVDTVSRAIPGADENLQKDMTRFVEACDRVKDAFQCAVLGVHHAGKSGDMRGSTVMRGAGDFVFHLERKEGATVARLHCEKQKDGPSGWSEPYRFDVVDLGDGETSWVPERCEQSIGPDKALTPVLAAGVLDAMDRAWRSGAPWGRTYHAGDLMAARIMVRDFGFTMDKAEETLSFWLATGDVVEDVLSAKSKKKGLRVAREVGTDVAQEGVFA